MNYQTLKRLCAADAVAYDLIAQLRLPWDAGPLETLRRPIMVYNITPKEQS